MIQFLQPGIRLVPYWNVNVFYRISICSLISIRLVPYWNVNEELNTIEELATALD